MNKVLLITICVLLSACANLQPKIDDVSVQSYERGCTLRGIQRGMTEDIAQQVCRCHIEKAIEATSPQRFIAISEKLGTSTPQERQTEPLKSDLSLMKSTFQTCKKQIDMAQ
ncbi:MAG: hypothetical protein MI867_25290 [Pseudomonadales bacterium]|nr:hypothetical protein [Pseudomonadales bacterium]